MGEVIDHIKWLEHTHVVLDTLSEVELALLRAESARRGFVLTGRAAYAEESRAAGVEARGRLSELRKLTSDNPKQQAPLQALEQLLAARFAQLDESLAAFERTHENDATQARLSDAGAGTRNEINRKLAEVRQTEQTLLGQRGDAVSDGAARARSGMVAGSVARALIVLAVFFA